jgi:hypothetical protein
MIQVRNDNIFNLIIAMAVSTVLHVPDSGKSDTM